MQSKQKAVFPNRAKMLTVADPSYKLQSDIQYWEDILAEDIQHITAMLEDIPHMKGADNAGSKRSFKMEIRLVQDQALRKEYEARLNRLDQQLKVMQQDCKAFEAENARGELFTDGGDEQRQFNEADGVKAGDSMLKEASALQDKTQDSLVNTKNMIAASKEVGVATLEELERQRNVIQNIEKETDRLDDNLARAEALIKQFSKRMASDHFIQCFAMINCILLVVVVLYAIIKKGSLTGNNDSAPVAPERLFLRRG